jgi:hypothetical protein
MSALDVRKIIKIYLIVCLFLKTLASQIPQELRVKLMQHFGIAKEYEKNPETISITYYCLMYIANEALKLQKEKQFVSNVLDYLESVWIN